MGSVVERDERPLDGFAGCSAQLPGSWAAQAGGLPSVMSLGTYAQSAVLQESIFADGQAESCQIVAKLDSVVAYALTSAEAPVAYGKDLAGPVREVLPDGVAVTGQQMSGGLVFMLSGHMFCGVVKNARVLGRRAAALGRRRPQLAH